VNVPPGLHPHGLGTILGITTPHAWPVSTGAVVSGAFALVGDRRAPPPRLLSFLQLGLVVGIFEIGSRVFGGDKDTEFDLGIGAEMLLASLATTLVVSLVALLSKRPELPPGPKQSVRAAPRRRSDARRSGPVKRPRKRGFATCLTTFSILAKYRS
jgi:hypothetical protein